MNSIGNIFINELGNRISGLFPTRITCTTVATAGIIGGALVGLPGAALGVVLGVAISPIANGSFEAIKIGSKAIYNQIGNMAHHANSAVKQILYPVAEELSLWLLTFNISQSSKDRYVKEQAQYTEKLRNEGSDLTLLSNPIPGSVATQQSVTDILHKQLYKQALAEEQPISLTQLKQWIALGEHLLTALTSDKVLHSENGKIGVAIKHPTAGQPDIFVESSRYAMRAISWYVMAQALWQAQIQAGTSTEIENMKLADDILSQATFVFNDPGSNLFKFIQASPTVVTIQTDVLDTQSIMDEQGQAATIDDNSRLLPGGLISIAIKPLRAIDGKTKRVALQLQQNNHARLWLPKKEGHEEAGWRRHEFKILLAHGTNALIEKYFPPRDINKVKTEAQIHLEEVQAAIVESLRLDPKDFAQHITALQQMSLFEILNLFQSNSAKVSAQHKSLHFFIKKLSVASFNQLRNKVIEAIKKNAYGGWEEEFARVNGEIPVVIGINQVEALQKYVQAKQESLHAAIEKKYPPKKTHTEQVYEGGKIALSILGGAAAAGATNIAYGIAKGIKTLWHLGKKDGDNNRARLHTAPANLNTLSAMATSSNIEILPSTNSTENSKDPIEIVPK